MCIVSTPQITNNNPTQALIRETETMGCCFSMTCWNGVAFGDLRYRKHDLVFGITKSLVGCRVCELPGELLTCPPLPTV